MLWLMFPAYNEKENLIKLLPAIDDFLKNKVPKYQILVIDDGSTDSTKNIKDCFTQDLPIQIISHDRNRGVGEVFKTGFSAVCGLAAADDLLIVLEGDGTSDHTLIPKMIDKLESDSDIVIASRYRKGGAYKHFPIKRHLLSLLGNIVLRTVFPLKSIRDYTIFFRGYRVSLLKNALLNYKDKFITSKTFLANTEVLINLTRLTYKVSEVPFVYSYERKIGESKMPVLKTLFDYLGFIASRCFASPFSS